MGNQNKGQTKDKESQHPQRPIVNKTGPGSHPINAKSTNSNSSLAPSAPPPTGEPKVGKAKCKFIINCY